MKTVLYYVGYLVLPLLFLLCLIKNSSRDLYRTFGITVQETKNNIASHRRYYGKD